MKNVFMILMHKQISLLCSLSIPLFLLFSIIAGCSKQVIRMPSRLPPIVKEYKHVTFSGGPQKIKKTGIYLNTGDNISILTKDYLLRSYLIAMIGKDDLCFGISYIDSAYKSGDLYLGNLIDRYLSFGVDIIVWKNEDYVQIADFLNEIKVKAAQMKRIIHKAKSDQDTKAAKEELNKILHEKTKLQKEANNLREKEAKLIYEVASLSATVDKTRLEAETVKKELASMRAREAQLVDQVNELKNRLNRGMAPVLIVTKPKNNSKMKSPTTMLHLTAIDDKGINKIRVF